MLVTCIVPALFAAQSTCWAANSAGTIHVSNLPTHTHTLANISDSGDLAALNTVSSAEIDDSAVTLAKITDIAEATFLGRASSSGTGAPVAMTPTQAKAALGITTRYNKGFAVDNPADGVVDVEIEIPQGGTIVRVSGHFSGDLTAASVMAHKSATATGTKTDLMSAALALSTAGSAETTIINSAIADYEYVSFTLSGVTGASETDRVTLAVTIEVAR